MAGVHGEGCQHREDLVVEAAPKGLVVLRDLVVVVDLHAFRGQLRADLRPDVGVVGDELPDAVADGVQLLGGREAVEAVVDAARLVLAPQAGHPDLEELVQVGREDREELHALQERVARVASLVQDARVELDPGELAVEDRTLLIARGPTSTTACDARSGGGSNGGHGPLAVALGPGARPMLAAARPGPGRGP